MGIFHVVFCELREHRNANRLEKHKHTIPGRAARFDVYIVGFVQTVRPVIAVKLLRRKEYYYGLSIANLKLCSLQHIAGTQN